jgi:hypothetical protein
MIDDIVTRLRKSVNDVYFSYSDVLEAADEIERLRAELADWKKVAEYEHAGFCGCCGQDESHLLNTLEVYVRNR